MSVFAIESVQTNSSRAAEAFGRVDSQLSKPEGIVFSGPQTEIRILGPLEALDAAGASVPLGGHSLQALLAMLLISDSEPLSPARLADELWQHAPPANAERTVQVYISRLRQHLAEGLGTTVELNRKGLGYVVTLHGCRYDVHEFERISLAARKAAAFSPGQAAELYRDALELWRGTVLAELADLPMAAAEAERLADRRAAVTEELAAALLDLGEPGEARRVIGPVVDAYPLREQPRLLLMRSLYREGRHAEALEQFSLAMAALDAYGLQPGPALRQLHQAILRHELPEAGTPLARPRNSPMAIEPVLSATSVRKRRTPRVRGTSVPTHPMLGRTSELHGLAETLADPRNRLVTIHGPGGIGKTRLALAAAFALGDRYPDGAWFVSLAALTSAWEVPNEIARTLRVGEPATGSIQDAVTAWLSIRRPLIVLDNFEHVSGARQIVADLLSAASGLAVIVTSREPLGIAGEAVLPLGPLEPEDAAELFLERASAVRPILARESGETQAGVVDEICSQLDYLPLALELVAARAALYSLPVLAGRITDRLSLTDPTQRLPARQHTLRSTVDWSYQLLGEEEQTVFRAMALFPDGARIDAVEDVVGDPGLSVVDLLGGLIMKSLLVGTQDADGEPRVRMLPTIHAFAAELPGPDPGARMRHAQHFLALAREAEPHMFDSEQARFFDRFDAERDNLSVGLAYLTRHAPADALALATRMANWWDIRGYHSEVAAHLVPLIDRFGPSAAPVPGTELDLARGQYQVARAIMQQLRFDEAAELLTSAYPVLDRHGDLRTRQRVLGMQATLAQAEGLDAMKAAVEAAAAVAQESGDDWTLGVAAGHMAQLHDAMGDFAQAQLWAECYLGCARRTANPVHLANATFVATLIALGQGHSTTASELAEEALVHCDAIGHESLATIVRSLSLTALLLEGDLDAAHERLREALNQASPESRFAGSDLIAAGAGLFALEGDVELAALLWGYHDNQFGDGLVPMSAYLQLLRERCEPAARNEMDADTWERADGTGRALDFEGALAAIRGGLDV